MSTVLIDTDIAIDYLRGHPYAQALLISLWERKEVFLSILSTYELFAGMHAKEAVATQNFVEACRVEEISLAITQKAAEHYQFYRKKGITLTTVDCLIFATAKVKQHKVATRNLRHYPDHSILLKF